MAATDVILWLSSFRTRSLSMRLVVALVLVVVVAVFDYLSGYYVSFSLFYLLPVLFVSLSLGMSEGLLAALLCACVWFYNEYLVQPEELSIGVLMWNTGIRLGFFSITAWLSSGLARALEHERDNARTDMLTGLANLQGFLEHSSDKLEECNNRELSVSLAYIDCDNFKIINDTLGHTAGNHLLALVGQTVREHCKSTDVPARMGGDEFVILMPDTNAQEAETCLRRLQSVLLDLMKTNKWPVTFSIGLITYKCPYRSLEQMVLEQLIQEGDALMYQVKTQGKNNIMLKEHQNVPTHKDTQTRLHLSPKTEQPADKP